MKTLHILACKPVFELLDGIEDGAELDRDNAPRPGLGQHKGPGHLQGRQLYMDVCFWYLVKSDLSCVRMFSSVHWTSHFLQGT